MDESCIWMKAGVLTYKLCDAQFECDTCPLDVVLRQSHEENVPATAHSFEHIVECALPGQLTEEVQKLLTPYCTACVHTDRYYSDHFMWVHFHHSTLVEIGIDEYFLSTLPASTTFVLGARKTPLQRGTPFGWAYFGHVSFPLLAPISGSIVTRYAHCTPIPLPFIAKTNLPGSLCTVLPVYPDSEERNLICAETYRSVLHKQMARFVRKACRELSTDRQATGIFVNDGGVPVQTLEEVFGSEAYIDLVKDAFQLQYSAP